MLNVCTRIIPTLISKAQEELTKEPEEPVFEVADFSRNERFSMKLLRSFQLQIADFNSTDLHPEEHVKGRILIFDSREKFDKLYGPGEEDRAR